MKKITTLFLCFVCMCQWAFAQQPAQVKGQIKDEAGEALIGATVIIKGTQNATLTDIDGNYALNYSGKNAVLQVRYIGYKNFEAAINGRTTINVTLTEDQTILQEVEVVAIAYGAQKKVTLTGALSAVSGEQLLKVPVANVANMLAGTMPGISTIQYSGQPGADNPEIFIRGISTFNSAASQPLFLIDGIERDFFQLDPNEIESITTLKDASVTAVYGIRGANGVILVTTKRGVEGRAKISGTFSYGVQEATRLLDFANSYEYALYKDEAQYKDNKPYIYRQGATIEEDLANPNSKLYQIKNHTNPLIYPDTDWMKMILNQYAPQTIANVNVSGGTKTVRYFTSVGFLNQEGIFKNFDTDFNANFYYNRYNYRTNLDVDFTPTSTLSLNLGGRLEERNRPISNEDQEQLFRHIYWATPLAGAGIVNGKWIKSNTEYVGSVGSDGLDPYYGKGFYYSIENVLNLDLAYKQDLKMLTPGLNFNIKGAYNSGNVFGKTRKSSIEYYVPTYKKDMPWLSDSQINPDELVLVQNGTRGTLSYSEDDPQSAWRNWYVEAALNYNRTFGDHDINALLLANQTVKYYPSTYTGVANSYAGIVSRIIYNYKTTYLADFSIGYNGSENFDSGRRYGIFPAGSVGWIMTNEPFMQGIDWLDHLKIRASFGIVGNDKASNNRFLYLPDTWKRSDSGNNRGDQTGYNYNFGTGSTYSPGVSEDLIGNPLVTWETAAKQDYGFDFAVLKNRLTGTIDYYYENRKDILWTAESSPSILGMALPKLNLGKMRNEGIEFDLKWNDKIDKVKYGVKFNMAYTKNTVVYMDEVLSPYAYANQTGHSINQNFGYKVRGFYYDGMPDVPNQSGYELKPGDVVYKDLNGDGFITSDDVCAIGYPNYPLLNGGITLDAQWNGFDISILFTGAALTSRLLEETYREPLSETGNRALLQWQFDNRWTSPESVNKNTLPHWSFDSRSNNYMASDLFIRDASYIRLKNFQIGYNFNAKFMKTLALKQLRLYVSGYNLFTWDKLKLMDPEMYGRSRADYPVMRILNFGVNATF